MGGPDRLVDMDESRFSIWIECPHCHKQTPIMGKGKIDKTTWKMILKEMPKEKQ